MSKPELQRQRELDDNAVPPGYTAEQHAQFQQEREQNIAEWKAEWDKFNRGERSTEPGRPAHSQQLMEWWHAKADAANAANAAKRIAITNNVIGFGNQHERDVTAEIIKLIPPHIARLQEEQAQQERVEVPRIAAQMKIDADMARLVYRHDAGFVLSDNDTRLVKRLKKRSTKLRAESALGITRPDGEAGKAAGVTAKSELKGELWPADKPLPYVDLSLPIVARQWFALNRIPNRQVTFDQRRGRDR